MEEAIVLVRSIMGLTRCDIRPLACAIALAAELRFERGMDKNDIAVTKHIYPEVARRLKLGTAKTVGRRIERLACQCWDVLCADKAAMLKYIGKEIPPGAPSELIFCLSYYYYFSEPFYQVIAREPALAF